MALKSLALVLLAAGAGATELTPDNWDAETVGKSVFIKFQAPWCGHCKKLKPDWDRLMDDFKGSPTSLVADVDCTAAGEKLCEKVGVEGYPTIKYGDPDDLKNFDGGRTYEDMKKFADENLGPQCGPENLDLCDAATRKKVEAYMAMPADKLEAKITKAQDMVAIDIPVMKKVIGHLKKKKAEL